MKNTLYIFLAAVLFLSCRSNTKQPGQDTSENKAAITQANKLLEKFKPIIQGVWVKKDYIDKVIETKSPLAAGDKTDGITVMYINIDNIKADSLVVRVGLGNHEGGEIITKFKPGQHQSTIILNDYFNSLELGYSIEKGDTSLILYQTNIKTNQVSQIIYIKALNKEHTDDLGYGMNYLINKGLVSGKYLSIDSPGKKSNVVFTNKGKVSGLSNFKDYFINDDFGFGPMDNLNTISFNFYSKHQVDFAFKINNDTLSLYDTHANADSTELILGKRIYKLVRQK